MATKRSPGSSPIGAVAHDRIRARAVIARRWTRRSLRHVCDRVLVVDHIAARGGEAATTSTVILRSRATALGHQGWRSPAARSRTSSPATEGGARCGDHVPPLGLGYGRRPALAGITGGRRWWTVSAISRASIPWR